MARLRPEWKNMKNEYKVDLVWSPYGDSTDQERKPRKKGQNRAGKSAILHATSVAETNYITVSVFLNRVQTTLESLRSESGTSFCRAFTKTGEMSKINKMDFFNLCHVSAYHWRIIP